MAERHPSPPKRDDDREGHYVFNLGENLTPRCMIFPGIPISVCPRRVFSVTVICSFGLCLLGLASYLFGALVGGVLLIRQCMCFLCVCACFACEKVVVCVFHSVVSSFRCVEVDEAGKTTCLSFWPFWVL